MVEAVGAAEEGFGGLPVADFALESGLIDGGDVGGVGDDGTERGGGEGGGEIGLDEVDAGSEGFGVGLGDGQGGAGEVSRVGLDVPFEGESNG